MSRFDPDPGMVPSARAGFEVRELVRRVAVEAFDAVEVDEPVVSLFATVRPTLTDPLVGVRAARLVADVAAGQMRHWALLARGHGQGWDDVAAALDLRAQDPDSADGRALGELAWEWLVEHRPPRPEPRGLEPASAVWVCETCRSRVRDTGPFASHPDDREHGHAPGCARHDAALAARRADLEDEQHQQDEQGAPHVGAGSNGSDDSDEFEEGDR